MRMVPKIDQLDVALVVNQYVFKFDITMHYVLVMAVADGIDNLPEDEFGFILR